MKTIFDKIDPKLIECTGGACEHASHQLNGPLLVLIGVLTIYTLYVLSPTRA